MVAEPQTEPFITEELAELAKGLEGVIHEPRSLPQELREMPVWLKVTPNERDQWKQPCVEFRGRLVPWNWQISSYHLALDKVLKQQPEGKAGFYAKGNLCVIDLDEVIDPVTHQLIEPKILELLNTLKASVYLSSSGTGLHIPFRLQQGVEIDPPGKNLSYRDRDTEGGTGQFLGSKFPSFVAFTGVAVPSYDYGWLVEITQAEWNDIREFLWSVETIDRHSEPLEPIPLATPVSTPQARAPREPEPKESPFGIRWKPKYQAHVKAVLAGFDDPREGSDTSISGRCFQWIGLYMRGSEHPTLDGAEKFSKQVEGFYRSKQSNPREKKVGSWHKTNVWKVTNDLLEDKRLGYLDPGERKSKMPFDELKLQTFNYAQGADMKPTSRTVLLTVVSLSEGRDRFKLRDAHIAKAARVHRDTVIQAKKELTNGSFLEIKGNYYTFL